MQLVFTLSEYQDLAAEPAKYLSEKARAFVPEGERHPRDGGSERVFG